MHLPNPLPSHPKTTYPNRLHVVGEAEEIHENLFLVRTRNGPTAKVITLSLVLYNPTENHYLKLGEVKKAQGWRREHTPYKVVMWKSQRWWLDPTPDDYWDWSETWFHNEKHAEEFLCKAGKAFFE